jgi:hypothetical protein
MRNARLQVACACGGFVAPPLALLALFGAGVFPPQAAHDSAASIARFYAHHSQLKMAGLFVGFMAIALLGPLVTVITLQMLRIEGRRPLLSFLQLLAGAVTWVFLSVPLLILFVAAYRAHRDPQLTQTLHDLGWILFLIPIGPFIVQNLAIAAAILTDDPDRPVFPRWVAYCNVVIATSFLPDALLGFFKAGPFAYQGLFAFWVPTVTYGLWLNIMAFATRRAVLDEIRLEAQPLPAQAEPQLAPA